MHSRSNGLRQGVALAGALMLPALGAVLGGMVQVTRCVAVPEGVAQLGIRLALLRPAADCPTTGLALGGEREQVLGVALMLTVPMVVLHLLAVGGSWGAAQALRRSLARLARLTPWGRLPRAAGVTTVGRRLLPRPALVVASGTPRAGGPPLRGPPVTVPA